MTSPAKFPCEDDPEIKGVRADLQFLSYSCKDVEMDHNTLYKLCVTNCEKALLLLCRNYRKMRASDKKNGFLSKDCARMRHELQERKDDEVFNDFANSKTYDDLINASLPIRPPQDKAPKLDGGNANLAMGSPQDKAPKLDGGNDSLTMGPPQDKAPQLEPQDKAPKLDGGNDSLTMGPPQNKASKLEPQDKAPKLDGGNDSLTMGPPQDNAPKLDGGNDSLTMGPPQDKAPKLDGGNVTRNRRSKVSP